GPGTHPDAVHLWETLSIREPFAGWLRKTPLRSETDGGSPEAYLRINEAAVYRSLASLLGIEADVVAPLISDLESGKARTLEALWSPMAALLAALPAVEDRAFAAEPAAREGRFLIFRDDLPQAGVDYLVDWYEILDVPEDVRLRARQVSPL